MANARGRFGTENGSQTSRSGISAFLKNFCELIALFAPLRGSGDGVHRHRPSVSGRNNFKGLADYDVFTADVRLQTERYEVVCHSGELLCCTARAYLDSATFCRQFGGYRFAKRRILVSPALVTSAPSLRKLSKARCHAMDIGLLLLPDWRDMLKHNLRLRHAKDTGLLLLPKAKF